MNSLNKSVGLIFWNFKINQLLCPIYLLAGILLVACSTSPPLLSEKQQMTTRMGDTSAIEVIEMRSAVRNNLLTAQVTVKNWGPKADKNVVEQVADNNKLYSYRFKWLNSNGMLVFGDESWKPLTLSRDQSSDLLGIAPNPDATTFRFEINQYK
jgi:uncharacterized protein YcfL